MEDSQKDIRNSQKEMREELKYELNKAIVDSQTQTRQLIKSLLEHRSPKAPRHGNQPTSTLSHEQRLMTSEGSTPSLGEITHLRSRPKRTLKRPSSI